MKEHPEILDAREGLSASALLAVHLEHVLAGTITVEPEFRCALVWERTDGVVPDVRQSHSVYVDKVERRHGMCEETDGYVDITAATRVEKRSASNRVSVYLATQFHAYIVPGQSLSA
jgi:hypothetical protein